MLSLTCKLLCSVGRTTSFSSGRLIESVARNNFNDITGTGISKAWRRGFLNAYSCCRSIMVETAKSDPIATEATNLNGFRLALIQLSVGANKKENLSNASKLIKQAAEAGAKLIALPECFNCPYGTKYFADYAETIPDGDTCKLISSLAKELKAYIIAGSIPELGEKQESAQSADEGNASGKTTTLNDYTTTLPTGGLNLYNTSTMFDPNGNIVAKHRKVHLFDIDVPGKITFKESDVLSPGNDLTTVSTDFCKIGIGICYDIRFPEMALKYRQLGCKLLVYPGAFNMTTGPAHWELLQKSRAVDNQVYVATISPARDEKADYVAWGHSMVVDPWGNVKAEAQEKETIIYADIDLDYLQQVRQQIPVTTQKRYDVYNKDIAS